MGVVYLRRSTAVARPAAKRAHATSDVPDGVAEADLSGGKWLAHPDLDSNLTPAQARRASFRLFRRRASFAGQGKGLRRPQLGALHAIQRLVDQTTSPPLSHRPEQAGPETMLATVICCSVHPDHGSRALDALRTQIALGSHAGHIEDTRSVMLKAGDGAVVAP